MQAFKRPEITWTYEKWFQVKCYSWNPIKKIGKVKTLNCSVTKKLYEK